MKKDARSWMKQARSEHKTGAVRVNRAGFAIRGIDYSARRMEEAM